MQDERGTREYNLALGDRRATTVMNYLVALGIGQVAPLGGLLRQGEADLRGFERFLLERESRAGSPR